MLKRIEELDRKEANDVWNTQMHNDRKQAKKLLHELLFKEEISLRQKSKILWVKEGDANMKLFHKMMNCTKSINTITKLESDDGSLVDDEELIVKNIVSYFEKLYLKDSLVPSPSRLESELGQINWSPVSSMRSLWLERPFEKDEVKCAIVECEGSKAPGPDGFSLALFQSCWDSLRVDLMKIVSEFFQTGIINGITNETYICLIPKKYNSSRIKDLRPISLVTSLYKIISKVLALRLREVLGGTISKEQGAFVKGRQILHVALVANEVVEEYRVSGKEGVVFKVDFEKAYDHVDWNFLDFALEKMDLGLP